MTTKQMEPDVDPRDAREEREPKANRTKKIGALAGAIVLAAVALIIGTRGGENASTPAGESPRVAPVIASDPFLLDIRTGERSPLAESLAGGFNYAASPDGTRLAYGTCCSEADVMTVANIDGTDAHTLEAPEGLNYYGARWSPDGTKIVYQERNGGGDTALTGDVGNLFVEDLASGRRTQLTDLELSRAWWWFLSPSFSPDGRNVIFHLPRGRSETTKWDVWSVPVTGGEPKLVLRNASFPMVSAVPILPNGVRIAFVSPWPNDFAGRRIMAARLLSPPDIYDLHQTLVKAHDSIQFPTMSPDGSRIAYQDGDSIYVFDFSREAGVGSGESSKVTDGSTADWLDDDTPIVTP
jgi:dipeptidyl aminopeptidase/acylaminoacyl peptidase